MVACFVNVKLQELLPLRGLHNLLPCNHEGRKWFIATSSTNSKKVTFATWITFSNLPMHRNTRIT